MANQIIAIIDPSGLEVSSVTDGDEVAARRIADDLTASSGVEHTVVMPDDMVVGSRIPAAA